MQIKLHVGTGHRPLCFEMKNECRQTYHAWILWVIWWRLSMVFLHYDQTNDAKVTNVMYRPDCEKAWEGKWRLTTALKHWSSASKGWSWNVYKQYFVQGIGLRGQRPQAEFWPVVPRGMWAGWKHFSLKRVCSGSLRCHCWVIISYDFYDHRKRCWFLLQSLMPDPQQPPMNPRPCHGLYLPKICTFHRWQHDVKISKCQREHVLTYQGFLLIELNLICFFLFFCDLKAIVGVHPIPEKRRRWSYGLRDPWDVLFVSLFVCLFVCFVSLFLCFFVCLFVCLIRYYTHSLSSNSSVTLIADSSIADQSVCAFGPPWRAYSLTMSRCHFSWKPQRTIEVNTTELKNGIPKKCAEIINQWTSVMGNFGKSISRELIHSESICVELRHDVVIFFPRGRWLSSRNAVFCCLFLPAAKWTLIFTRYFTCVAPWGLDIFYCEGKLGQSDVRYLTPKYCLNASLFCSPRKGVACRSMEIYLDLYYWHLGLLYANSNLHENIAQIDLDFFPCRCCWVNPQSVKAELGFLNMESMCAQTPLLGFTHSDFPVSHQLFACWQSSSSWRFIGQRPHILGCHVWLRIPLLCPNTSPTQPMAMGQQAQNRDLALLHGNFMTFTVKIISCR